MGTRQTFSIRFYCRPSKVDKDGKAPIEMSLVINGARTYFKLQHPKIDPAEFEKDMKSKKDNKTKQYCERQKELVADFIDQMADNEIELTAENLKECLKRNSVSQLYTLGDLWNDIINNKAQELSLGEIDDLTYRKYPLAKKAFYDANGFTDATPAKIVELQHINKLQYFLKNKKMAQATIYNYHARVKAAFTLAFNRGKIKSNPYAGFKMTKGERKEIVWLSDTELQTLKDKTFSTDRLTKVRDLFLFQCYSGLAYSDMALLEKDDYKENNLGQIYIQKRRKKTNVKFVSVVLTEGREILESYDYELPVLCNQKYNAYLKEVQDLCEFTKTLHSHLGRTTYVCYLYNKGVSVETIAKLVGHTTCKTTLKYYAELDNSTIFTELRNLGAANKIANLPTDEETAIKSIADEIGTDISQKDDEVCMMSNPDIVPPMAMPFD